MDSLVKCSHCGKEVTRGYLDTHYRTHTGEKPFNCPRCSYKSGHESAVKAHLLVGKRKPEECPHCDFKSCTHQALVKHKRKVHPNCTEPVKSFEKLSDALMGGIESTDPPLKAIEFLRPKSRNPTEQLPFNINAGGDDSSSDPPKETSDLGLQDPLGASTSNSYRLGDAMPLNAQPSKNSQVWKKGIIEINWKVKKRSKLLPVIEAKVEIKENMITCLEAVEYFACQFCNFCCYDSPEFEQHLVSRRTGSPLQCDQCTFRSCTTSCMETHVSDLHPMSTNEIVEELTSKPSLVVTDEQEVTKILGTTPLTETCIPVSVEQSTNEIVKELTSKPSLQNCSLHTGERPYKCAQCSYTGTDQSALLKHMNAWNGSVYHCLNCKMKFCFEVSLKKHMKECQNAEKSGTPPPVLRKYNDDDEMLVDQEMEDTIILTNSEEPALPRMKCLDCDLIFNNDNLLQKHKSHEHKSHLPPITETNRSSKNIENRKKDEPARPFGKEVRVNLIRLDLSKAAKSQSKNNVCLYCHKMFGHPNSLRKHIRTHTGEKPFKCNRCSFATAHQNRLFSHKQSSESRNGDLIYCSKPDCGFKSCTSHFLQMHLKEAHSGSVSEKPGQPLLVKQLEKRDDEDEFQKIEHVGLFPIPEIHIKEDKEYKCQKCSYCTNYKPKLEIHMAFSEKNAELHECPKCDLTSCTRQYLQVHMTTKHKVESIAQNGGNRSRTLRKLRLRFSAHDQDPSDSKERSVKTNGKRMSLVSRSYAQVKLFQCERCCYSANRKSSLEGHMMSWRRPGHKLHRCSGCDFISCTTKYLAVHRKENHLNKIPISFSQMTPEAMLVCRYCKKEFTGSNRIRHHGDHVRIHTGEKPYKCSRCSFAAAQSSTLRSHMLIRSKGVVHHCSYCDFTYCTRASLRKHISDFHLQGTSSTPQHIEVTATDSERSASERYKHNLDFNLMPPKTLDDSLIRNVEHRIVTCPFMKKLKSISKAKFCCEYCSLKFRRRAHLIIHRRSHTGEKPFKCSICPYSSTRMHDLRRHELTHKNMRQAEALSPLKIQAAKNVPSNGIRFRRENIRKLRSKQQQRSGRFECGYCSYRALDKSRLIIHERTHTGEKPYQCQVCGKKFSQKGSLYRHKYKRVKCSPNSSKVQVDFQPFDTIQKVESLPNQPTQQSSQMSEFLDSTLIGKRSLQSDTMITENSSQSPMVSEIDLWNQPELAKIIPEDLATSQQHPEISNHNNNAFSPPQLIITSAYSLNDIPFKSRVSKKKKLFRCDICNFKTPHQGSLDVHMRIHTGEKPYKCYICPHRSARRHDMKLHEKTHGPRAEVVEIQT